MHVTVVTKFVMCVTKQVGNIIISRPIDLSFRLPFNRQSYILVLLCGRLNSNRHKRALGSLRVNYIIDPVSNVIASLLVYLYTL